MVVQVSLGNLYLDRAVCDHYLRGCEAVALIERDGQVLILPLTPQSGGGLLLKIRNARGDRVVHAQEFFRARSLVETTGLRSYGLWWDAERAALVVDGLLRPA
jgi:hypothetical protein